MGRKRIRDLGLEVGVMSPGDRNAISDVEGVTVGHTTLIEGEGALRPGIGPIRSGVTVILPHRGNLFQEKLIGAVHTINGYGKAMGFEQVRELGLIESPIALSSTLNVGLVGDAIVEYSIRQNPGIGITDGTVNAVVGECFDGVLSDVQGRHVRAEHVFTAIENASEHVEEGNVGGGTGTSCYGWKGGIGTASRKLPERYGGYVVGALVQSNFGDPADLTICGRQVGKEIRPPKPTPDEDKGSIMMVVATDAPMNALQMRRLCVRAGAGLSRTGSYYGHQSGDFVIGFSTANKIPHESDELVLQVQSVQDDGRLLNRLFQAVTESVEEAILNSMAMAETLVGRDGVTRHAFDFEKYLRS